MFCNSQVTNDTTTKTDWKFPYIISFEPFLIRNSQNLYVRWNFRMKSSSATWFISISYKHADTLMSPVPATYSAAFIEILRVWNGSHRATLNTIDQHHWTKKIDQSRPPLNRTGPWKPWKTMAMATDDVATEHNSCNGLMNVCLVVLLIC